jgi:hypothetical protein
LKNVRIQLCTPSPSSASQRNGVNAQRRAVSPFAGSPRPNAQSVLKVTLSPTKFLPERPL